MTTLCEWPFMLELRQLTTALANHDKSFTADD